MQIYAKKLTKTEISKIFKKDELLIVNYTEKILGNKNIYCQNVSKTIYDAIKLLSKFKETCLKDIQQEIMPMEVIDFYIYKSQESEYIRIYLQQFAAFYKRLYLFKVNTSYSDNCINYTRISHQNRFINFINYI